MRVSQVEWTLSHSDSFSLPRAPERILAVSIGGLGDTVLFSPVIRALRTRYPEAHIELLVASQLAGTAYAPTNEIDRLFVANTNYSSLFTKAVCLLPYSFRSRIRGGFDLGVFATGLNSKFIMFLKTLAGIRRIVSAPMPPSYETDFACNVALARRFDNDISEQDVFFPVTDEALGEAKRELARYDLLDTARVLAVYPSRELPHRPRWQLWKLARVIRLLKDKGYISKVVLVGSEEEGKEWQFADKEDGIDANLAGSLSILSIGALLSQCGIALGNDGGIMHVAGAVGCPLVVIMTSAPASYKPAGQKVRIVKSSLSCCDSSYPQRPEQCEIAKCTEDITVEAVLQQCLDILGTNGSAI
jgi:ADP-heptose:LPS heptosyltransferase